MAEPEPDYGSRQAEILKFISEHPKCTKTEVINFMKGRSAVTTTHAILKDMIRDGKINVYKKNLQTHLLTINQENEFIWINNALADIYSFIERCERIRKKLQTSLKNLPELREKKAISKNTEYQYVLFLQKFIPPIASMLNRLLTRTILEINSKDAQWLNRKIMDLEKKLYEMPLYAHFKSASDSEERLNVNPLHSDSAINSSIDKIKSDIQALKRVSFNQNLKLVSDYNKLTDDFEQMAENFMREFTRTLRAYHDSRPSD